MLPRMAGEFDALKVSEERLWRLGLYNERRKPEEQIVLCVGIGFGRVLRIGDADVWGKEVNAASKLGEDQAKGNEILVTEAVNTALADGKGDFKLEPAGTGFTASESVYRVL